MLKKVPDLIAEIRQNIQCITATEAAVKSKSLGGLLIDVRESAEFANKAARGAINIPRGVLEMKMVEQYSDVGMPLFIYCATGGRATFAAEQLKRLGYGNVWAITCKCEQVIEAQEEHYTNAHNG